MNKKPRNKSSKIWSNDFDRGAKFIQWRKGQSLQQTVLGKLNIQQQKNEVGLLPNTIKISSKCIRDPNVRAVTIKLFIENIGENLHDIVSGSDFLDVTSKT